VLHITAGLLFKAISFYRNACCHLLRCHTSGARWFSSVSFFRLAAGYPD
jgi:hypothetical protein